MLVHVLLSTKLHIKTYSSEILEKSPVTMMKLKHSQDPAGSLLKEWGEDRGTMHDLMWVLSGQDDGLKKIALLEDLVKMIEEYGVEVDCGMYPGLDMDD